MHAFDLLPSYNNDTRNGFPLGRFSDRLALASYYSAVRTLCSLGKDIATQVITTFLQTIYASHYLTLEDEFRSRMGVSLNNFNASAPTLFNDLLRLIQDTMQGNQLLTGGLSNARMESDTLSTSEEDRINILWINPINESCNCGISMDSCSLMYDQYCNFTYTWYADYTCSQSLPGVLISCYLMDSILLSTLQCFYDAHCMIKKYNNFSFED